MATLANFADSTSAVPSHSTVIFVDTLILIALVAGAIAYWRYHNSTRLRLPPVVRQIDSPRVMARAERLFGLYSAYLEYNSREYPSELEGAYGETRAAMVLVMWARARRDETTAEMLGAARAAYTLLCNQERDAARRRGAITGPTTRSENGVPSFESLRSEVAADRLAKQEFDTWFRAGLGVLGLEPKAVGWYVPDDADGSIQQRHDSLIDFAARLDIGRDGTSA